MPAGDWHLRSATDHAAAIRRGEVSSAALVEHYCRRIERIDKGVNAVVVRTFEEARARAAAADAAHARGESWGPLHGVPITVKEAFWLSGTLSTCAVAQTIDFVATSNAPAVQSLLDAGAVVLGKTNLPVAAADFQSFNDKYGTTNNPWDLSRSPGGSSGGSAAAIAAGLSALELGSDIGGSIRNPAHFCGVAGHKPSQGVVPLHGHSPGGNHPLAERDPKPNRGRMDPSFGHQLAVAGPIARTCADLELAMRILAKPEPTMAANGWSFTLPPAKVSEVSSLRVACWLDDAFCPVEAECVQLLRAAADAIAAAGASVDFDARPNLRGGWKAQDKAYQELLSASMNPDVRPMTYLQYQSVEVKRQGYKESWAEFFEDYDVMLCPVMPTAAFEHDHDMTRGVRLDANSSGPFVYRCPGFACLVWNRFGDCRVFVAVCPCTGREQTADSQWRRDPVL